MVKLLNQHKLHFPKGITYTRSNISTTNYSRFMKSNALLLGIILILGSACSDNPQRDVSPEMHINYLIDSPDYLQTALSAPESSVNIRQEPEDELSNTNPRDSIYDSIDEIHNELYIIQPPHRSPTFGEILFADDFTVDRHSWTTSEYNGDKGHLEVSFNTGKGPDKHKRRYFRRMYPESINADGTNEIIIIKDLREFQFYLNNTLVQRTYLRNEIDAINAIGFEQCTTGSWALDEIEVRVDAIYDGLHLLDQALDLLLDREFPGEEVQVRHMYMRRHNYMQGIIIVGGNRYFAQSGLYFNDGKPSLIMATLNRSRHQLFSVIPKNDDFEVQFIENYHRYIYPTDVSQILKEDAPEEVIDWIRENTQLIFSEEWRKEESLGFKDAIWQLEYPFTRTFIAEYAPYVRYFNGGIAWDGDRFRPVTYNIPLYIQFKWDMEFKGALPFFTSVTEMTELLGEPSELGEGPYCGTYFSSGLEMRWPGIAAEKSGEQLFLYHLNFELNPNIWISLGEGLKISGETTLAEFSEILPELRVSSFPDGTFPENVAIYEGYFSDGYGWSFSFTDGKLTQMNNGGPC